MPEVPRLDLAALGEDLSMARYTYDIERYAIVGDGALLEWATELGDRFVKMEVKHFDTSQYEEAWRWLRA